MNITFIGGGNMATAIIGGLVRQGGSRIQVIEHNEAKREHLSQAFGAHCQYDLPKSFATDEIIVLAVKPQQLKALCTELSPRLQGQLVVSIAAGIRYAVLEKWLGGHQRIIRVMPNTPAMVGKGVSGLFAPACLDLADKAIAQTIMQSTGMTVWLAQEEGIDDITCVSGSGPAYVFYFIESMIDAAKQVGFDAQSARQLVLETFEGAVTLAKQSPDDIETLRANVTSKGGTTAQAIARFDTEKVKAAIIHGAMDCRAHSIKMGQMLSEEA